MSDMPPTPDEIESDAEQYRILQAKRVIIACERLRYGDPRELSSGQVQRVQREIAANRDAIDATVVQRWPETFEGLAN
jgi:hypothetical protein